MCLQSLERVEVGCGEVLRPEGCSNKGREKKGKGEMVTRWRRRFLRLGCLPTTPLAHPNGIGRALR